jgi:hypothetical protein
MNAKLWITIVQKAFRKVKLNEDFKSSKATSFLGPPCCYMKDMIVLTSVSPAASGITASGVSSTGISSAAITAPGITTAIITTSGIPAAVDRMTIVTPSVSTISAVSDNYRPRGVAIIIRSRINVGVSINHGWRCYIDPGYGYAETDTCVYINLGITGIGYQDPCE